MITILLSALMGTAFAANNEYLIKVNPAESAAELHARFGEFEPVSADVILVRATANQISTLAFRPSVLHIEPNRELSLLRTPGDLRPTLWGLHNTAGPGAPDIDAPAAWDITTGSRNVVVAVIDTGVDLTHPDLRANLWTNMREMNGRAGVDDDRNGYVDDIHGFDFAGGTGDASDDHGHGTHVAGTIGAVGGNGRGVVGVSWKVKMMALRMFPKGANAQMSDAIRAVDYAVANGAHVINASWAQSADSADGDPDFVLLSEAIARAGREGVTFVAAAGNSSRDNDRYATIPATLKQPNIISVGAITRTGARASFSNYGRASVDVFAPGASILSTIIGGGVGVKSGTSMAAPHVAGLVALMLTKNPRLTPREIRAAIIASCTPRTGLSSRCAGYINAPRALRAIAD